MNGTKDYKIGQMETSLKDLKEDVKEWKDSNASQHNYMTRKMGDIQKDVTSIKEEISALKVQAGMYGAFAGIGGAIAVVVVKAIL